MLTFILLLALAGVVALVLKPDLRDTITSYARKLIG